MTSKWDHLGDRIEKAVLHYWEARREQGNQQGAEGEQDYGKRQNVTGGIQMDGFAALVKELLVEEGIPEEWIHYDSQVPGFYRPTKGWDLLIVTDENLLASIELKSQAGPSYGNNFNNRAEEALGNATDLQEAFEKEIIPTYRPPWLGYLMLLEEGEGSTTPVQVKEPHFNVDEVFRGASYADRYETLCGRLMRERLYDGSCLLLSRRPHTEQDLYREPHKELTFKAFMSDLLAHVQTYMESN